MSSFTRPTSMRPFFIVWTGQAFSLFGSILVQFALIWYLTQQTGSAVILATAALVNRIPYIVLGPFVGALVDRWNRRTVMAVSDGLTAVLTLLLAYLFMTGHVQIWHIYVLMFLRSLDNTFQTPAMQASTTLMVPDEHLARVAGLNQSLQGAMEILGPIAGALAMTLLPMQTILSIDIVTAVIAISLLYVVYIPQPERKETAIKTNALHDTLEGLRYLWSWPGMMILLASAAVMNFMFSPAFSLAPLLVKNHFHGGALELSWFQAGIGAGVVGGGLLLGAWGGFKKRMLTTLAGLTLIGLATLGLGLVPGNLLAVGVASALLVGLAMPLVNGPIMAVMQSVIPPDKQARVFALDLAISISMTPLGLLVAGPVADALGVQAWFIIAGAVVLVMTVLMVFIPAVMNVEQNAQGDPSPAEAAPAASEA